jgi:glycerol kinase
MFILALDQGTTSSRAMLFDQDGRVHGVAQQEFPQLYPQPGWVEHDPEDIWSSQIDVGRKVLLEQGLGPADVAAIGITNQRETVFLWERATGRPCAHAIVWQDRRTAAMCDALKEHADLFRLRTGLPIDPYFSATKIAWLLDHVSGLRERAEQGEIAFGTVDSFLLWRLTGGRVHATDVSNASRTLLFDIVRQDWDDDLLRLLRIPRSLLPRVLPSSTLYGETDPDLFGAPIPIAGVAGDQQAATFGQACVRPGMAKNTYGTGSFLMLNTGSAPHLSSHGLLTTIGWRVGAETTYALEGSVFITGAAVQWLRDELKIISSADEIEELAISVPDSGGVFFVPAFVGLGAPHWDAYARGALLGLTRGSGRAHIARATLEAACFQTCDVLDAMRADSGLDLAELRVDGGMTANNTMLQLQADLLGVRVVRPAVRETTALGAAYLAGLAVGFWPDIETVAGQWMADAAFEPRISSDERESRLAEWRRTVERTRGWVRPESPSASEQHSI